MVCDNDWKIDRDWLENAVVDEIESRFTAPDQIDKLIKNISANINNKNSHIDNEKAKLSKELNKCNTEIKRLLDAIKAGIDPSLISDEVNKIKLDKQQIEERIKELDKSYSDKSVIDTNTLKSFLTDFRKIYESSTIQERRSLLRTFIRHIEMRLDTKELKIEFYPDSIVQSMGKGELYHK